MGETGLFGTETTSSYVLSSSLDSAGIIAMGIGDYLEVAGDKVLRSGFDYWPDGEDKVRITGKFGWKETPNDIKLATAMLVFDRMKPDSDVLRRAERWQTNDAEFSRSRSGPTGLPVVDRVIDSFRRESY
jgi:hypothetical protein